LKETRTYSNLRIMYNHFFFMRKWTYFHRLCRKKYICRRQYINFFVVFHLSYRKSIILLYINFTKKWKRTCFFFIYFKWWRTFSFMYDTGSFFKRCNTFLASNWYIHIYIFYTIKNRSVYYFGSIFTLVIRRISSLCEQKDSFGDLDNLFLLYLHFRFLVIFRHLVHVQLHWILIIHNI